MREETPDKHDHFYAASRGPLQGMHSKVYAEPNMQQWPTGYAGQAQEPYLQAADQLTGQQGQYYSLPTPQYARQEQHYQAYGSRGPAGASAADHYGYRGTQETVRPEETLHYALPRGKHSGQTK